MYTRGEIIISPRVQIASYARLYSSTLTYINVDARMRVCY